MSATFAVVPLPTSTSSPNRAVSFHHSSVPLSSGRMRKSTLISSSSFISMSHSFLCRKVSRCSSSRHRTLFSPVMEWQDCTVKMDIDVATSTAYKCYSDREAIPQWMPFISSVKILEDKPELSRWSLKYKAFGHDIEFSWLAHNMQPIPNKKIHWRSLEGLPNRGVVRFFPKGASSCIVELTVSYEVPSLLIPVASALRPFLESLLVRGLEGFANFAKGYTTDQPIDANTVEK